MNRDLWFEVSVTLHEITHGVAKDIARVATNELYKEKWHTASCKEYFNTNNCYACAVYEYLTEILHNF